MANQKLDTKQTIEQLALKLIQQSNPSLSRQLFRQSVGIADK